MKNWLHFLNKNKRILNFGFLFSFFSLFGQTYFISFFKKSWTEAFNISELTIGSIFTVATIIAAALLSITGKYIDRLPLKKYSLIILSTLVLSAILLSQAYSIIVFCIGLLLVRWLGQGMMTHTSSTATAKYFNKDKGKALGITALGNTFAQFIIPSILLFLIISVGWRFSLIYTALAAVVIVLPSILLLKNTTSNESTTSNEIVKKDNSFLKTAKFWIIALNAVMIPFICTVIFFYQFTLGEINGWDYKWVAFSFSIYPIFSAISLLLSGHLIDRFSGLKLFPLYLTPTIIALILVGITNNKYILPIFYALLGISFGLGNTIKTAVQVEIYGQKNLGEIASYFSTILVLSTALGPAIYGFFLDQEYSTSSIMFGTAIFVLIVALISFKVKE